MTAKKSAKAKTAPEDDERWDDIEQIFDVASFEPDALIGQVQDFLVTEMKDVKERKPWAKMAEHEQRWLIERASGQARSIVAGVLRAVASRGFSKIEAIADGGSFKEGEIALKFKARISPENLEIIARHGSNAFVQLVFASAEDYAGDGEITPEPNQPPLDDEFVNPKTGEVSRAPNGKHDAPVFDNADAGR